MRTFTTTRVLGIFFLMLCGTTSMAFAKDTSEKIKDAIDHVSDSLKKNVDQLGDDFDAIQNYLDHYQWKGIIRGNATSEAVTLSELKLNGHHRVTVVKPGSSIDGQVICFLDPKKTSMLEVCQVVLGFKETGPQTTLSHLGVAPGKKLDTFKLKAPSSPGIYEIRFKTVNKLFETTALDAWRDADTGEGPDSSTTIGIVVVKS